MTDATDASGGIADLRPLARAREQKAWYWYDWANSAYVTTIATVMFAPYLIGIAENAAGRTTGSACSASRSRPGALLSFWLITFSTILSAVLLPLARARSPTAPPTRRACSPAFAWTGSALRVAAVLLPGDNWQIGAIAVVGANLCLGAAVVVQRRDPAAHLRGARARPGLLARLGVGLPRWRHPAGDQPGASFTLHDSLGLTEGMAARCEHAVGRALVGGVHVHPVPQARATTRPSTWCPRPVGWSRRASASWARRSRTCATTRWR